MPAGQLLESFISMGLVWSPRTSPPREKLVLISQDSRSKKFVVPADKHPKVANWQEDLYQINTFIGGTPIYLDLPDAEWSDVVPKANRKNGARQPLCLTQISLRRMFTRNKFDHGGRFYGGWWQNIPAKYRRHIVIGDQLTVECDYSGIAMRCLYAREGFTNIPDDPYDIGLNYVDSDDPRRSIVKEYINAMLNDESRKYRLPTEKLHKLGLTSRELKRRVYRLHSKVKQHFHTGVGMQLQFIDSEIAMAVMLRLAAESIVCLPVHDSFIVRGGALKRLKEVMAQEFQRITGIVAGISVDDKVFGDRMGNPQLTPPHPVSVAALNIHFERFSITQDYHAAYWQHFYPLGIHP